MQTGSGIAALDALPIWKAGMPGRPLAGLTVLIVEDSRYASEAMRLLCLRSGARIRRADCLRSAARHLQTYRPSVVIVDLGLPDGSGLDLIRQVAAANPRVPAIFGISGDPDGETAALYAGADGFLTKPIENLAIFQQAILGALPPDAQPFGLRALPNEVVSPDRQALKDDLAHVAEVLSSAQDTQAIDYIVRFLAGVAKAAHDRPLAEAATSLARDHQAGRAVSTDLARISGLVQDRLTAAGWA